MCIDARSSPAWRIPPQSPPPGTTEPRVMDRILRVISISNTNKYYTSINRYHGSPEHAPAPDTPAQPDPAPVAALPSILCHISYVISIYHIIYYRHIYQCIAYYTSPQYAPDLPHMSCMSRLGLAGKSSVAMLLKYQIVLYIYIYIYIYIIKTTGGAAGRWPGPWGGAGG